MGMIEDLHIERGNCGGDPCIYLGSKHVFLPIQIQTCMAELVGPVGSVNYPGLRDAASQLLSPNGFHEARTLFKHFRGELSACDLHQSTAILRGARFWACA